MRVIGGHLGGRRYNPPADKWPTRPTTDMAREALFNILQNKIDFTEIKALDLFGGSGSQCYELFSRGCLDITYVDRYYPCIKFVKRQVAEFDADAAIKIVKSDALKFINATDLSFDYIFCDPPYALKDMALIPDIIFKSGCLREDGMLVIEHDRQNDFTAHARCAQARSYGGTIFSFFQ